MAKGPARRVWLSLAAYLALVATLATPLYEPFESGRDDSWTILVLLAAAHVGVGFGVGRVWVLLVPVGASLVAFYAAGAHDLAWIVLFVGLPLGVALTATGWLAARVRGVPAGRVAAIAFAIAALPFAAGTFEALKRRGAPHVPPGVQARLPTAGGLCPFEGQTAAERRTDRERVATLITELSREPDALVTYTWALAEGPGEERRDITVREVAEEQLSELRAGEDCDPVTRRRIEDALGV